MRTNIDWLGEWLPIDISAEAVAETLTMAGLEVDSVTPAGSALTDIVIAEILERRAHPNADKLSICRVDDGEQEREIVCGAPNARAGIKVPFARVGAELPGGLVIKAAKIRGVVSEGMLCSARELALSEDAAGLLELDADAEVGRKLADHLKLDDYVLDVDLTANRGDCFSVLGIARELAAKLGQPPLEEELTCVDAQTDEVHEIELEATSACPRFAGRVIGGLSTSARSPDWLRERLRRSGIRAIHPVVDVTNYVMLEYGQPLHAYRRDKLDGPIEVRLAARSEKLRLLDDSELDLDDDTLVIADRSGAIGLAGIMGGASTGVDATTDQIFLESAYFAPAALQGRARRYGLHTDASVRFERGVDPSGQERAIERATALLLDIAGGNPGPLVVAEAPESVPVRQAITLDPVRVAELLGVDISREEIEAVLVRLGMTVEPAERNWEVTPPSYRFDIAIEQDLVEEIGRMIGYDRIPSEPGVGSVRLGPAPEALIDDVAIADFLAARGYNEIVSYSFTDAVDQDELLGPGPTALLANPLSSDLGAMRRSLWPGLIAAARLNLSRQQVRCRLFEVGTVFFGSDEESVDEHRHVAGLWTGSRTAVHWEGATADADYFDLKGDVDALLSLWRRRSGFDFVGKAHPALNPTRAAAIQQNETAVGWLGELHPRLQRAFGFKRPVFLFELDLTAIPAAALPRFSAVSRFPRVRRDLAVVVESGVNAADLTKCCVEVLGDSLERYEIFDQYRGQGLDTGTKSIGIGLILQGVSRTLTDDEADLMIQQVVGRLEHELGARIRT